MLHSRSTACLVLLLLEVLVEIVSEVEVEMVGGSTLEGEEGSEVSFRNRLFCSNLNLTAGKRKRGKRVGSKRRTTRRRR